MEPGFTPLQVWLIRAWLYLPVVLGPAFAWGGSIRSVDVRATFLTLLTMTSFVLVPYVFTVRKFDKAGGIQRGMFGAYSKGSRDFFIVYLVTTGGLLFRYGFNFEGLYNFVIPVLAILAGLPIYTVISSRNEENLDADELVVAEHLAMLREKDHSPITDNKPM